MFRISQMMNEVLRPNSTRLPTKPKAPVVIWNLIRRCNLTCRHCYSTSADIDFPGELTTEQAFAVIDDLAKYGVPALILSGGEPLLRHDIAEISNYCKEKGIYTGLSSNGTLITEDNIAQIKAANYDYVGISIDGNEKNHDYFRRREGGFREAMNGLMLCKAHDIKVGLRFTLTKDNFVDLTDILNIVREYEVDKFYLSHLNYSGRGKRNRGDDTHHQMTREAMNLLFSYCREDLEAGINREYVTGNNDADGVYFYHWARKHFPEQAEHILHRLKTWGGNATGKYIANIDNVGNVHPDTFWWNYDIGNVKTEKFSNIWENTSDPLMHAFRDEPRQLKGRCGQCSFSEICNGNTRVRAYVASGDPMGEDPGCYLSDIEIQKSDKKTLPLETWALDKPVRFKPQKILKQAEKLGTVYLVGAGPGDAELLTIKALRLIEKADVVVYDRLVSPEVIALIPKTTQTIYVGKSTSNHVMRQEEINKLLTGLAKTKSCIVRLKGGDPFIFGRGGEELQDLAKDKVPFEVVPGITSASGCSAYAGIPLTHRDYTQGVTFITGHGKKDEINIDFANLAKTTHTIVFYMGLSTFPTLSTKLIEYGMPADMPVAAIYKGTTPEQKIITGSLQTLPQQVANLQSPVLLIIGRVVSLSGELAWFEPLKNAINIEEVA